MTETEHPSLDSLGPLGDSQDVDGKTSEVENPKPAETVAAKTIDARVGGPDPLPWLIKSLQRANRNAPS